MRIAPPIPKVSESLQLSMREPNTVKLALFTETAPPIIDALTFDIVEF